MNEKSVKAMVNLVCRAITLAMGVAVVALLAMKIIDVNTAAALLGVGMTANGIVLFTKEEEKKEEDI